MASFEELEFISAVSKATGIDPRVVVTQVIAEGAYAPGGTGGHNYLNLRPYGTDVGVVGQSPGGFDQFKDVQSAVISSVRRLEQPFIWAKPELGGPGLGSVVAEGPRATPRQELGAIGRSGWDTGHYGSPPGSKLLAIFSQQYGAAALDSPAQSKGVGPGAPKNPKIVASGPGTAAPGSVVGGAAGAVGGALSAGEKLFKFLTSYRFLELVGGIVLVAVGLVILARALTRTAPVQILGQTVGNYGSALEQGASRPAAARAAGRSLVGAPPKRRARPASREGTGRPSNVRSFPSDRRPSQAARARAVARRARQSDEVPF